MSIIRSIKARLGLSVTPANNFVLDASADNGTMKLARESGQDVMTVDAAGVVAFPQNPKIGFVGSFSGSGISTTGNVSFTASRNDGGCYSAGRFTPTVAGWYSLSCSLEFSITSMSYGGADLKFNGALVRRQVQGPYNGTAANACVSAELYFNGTTDYAEFHYIASPTGGSLTTNCFSSASLVQRG